MIKLLQHRTTSWLTSRFLSSTFTPKMPTSISTLPPELLARVLTFVDNFSTIHASILTCRQFHQAWLENKVSIARRLLPRLIPCLSLAEQLARVQEQHQPSSSTDRTERIVRNARSVALACRLFIADVVVPNMPDRGNPPYLSDSERLRFTYSFYHVWIALCSASPELSYEPAVTLNRGTLPANLQSMSPRQLHGVDEITLWLYCNCGNEYLRQIDVALCKTSGKNSLTDESGKWLPMLRHIHLAWLDERGTLADGVLVPKGAPLGIFAIFDNWQEYAEMIPDYR